MRLHRFYTGKDLVLKRSFWIHDANLINQWRKVLRYQAGSQVVLYNGVDTERLYTISEINDQEAHLQLVTEIERKLPQKNLYLYWALLKKDKNDWVLQKATELGVSHFTPLITERTERINFDINRARKIVEEASEQCGRSDIPAIREPMQLTSVINSMSDKIPLVVCEQGDSHLDIDDSKKFGLLIGPEGGWTQKEKELFRASNLSHIGLGEFTLRAETASIVAISQAMNHRH